MIIHINYSSINDKAALQDAILNNDKSDSMASVDLQQSAQVVGTTFMILSCYFVSFLKLPSSSAHSL